MKLNAKAVVVALGLVTLLVACGGTDPAPTTGPDLVMQSVTVTPTDTLPGGTVEIEFTIVNAGDETADASTTRISINQSGDSVAGSTQLRDVDTAAITAGSSLNLSGPVTLPELPAGDYFIWATADVNQESGQGDRSNDSRATGITITTDASMAACTEGSQVIDIPDANLAGRVRVNLEIAEATEILCQDMRELTNLSAVNFDISNLEGLQHAINLSELNLNRNEITDLSPLAGLRGMESLNLIRNEISSVAPLANLTELTFLSLGRNNIGSIAPLANLTDLEHLEVNSNPVGSLAPVAGMTGLRILYADSSEVTDLNALQHLQGLQELGLSNNSIGDLTPLSGLANVWLLTLDGNEISDLSPLEGLLTLSTLHLAGNRISDIGPLVANTGLGSGDSIYLQENCLDLTESTPARADLDVLVARGAVVVHESQRECSP